MNLDELQSVQSRERQASQLQHLRATFYEEVAEYIGELRAERNEVAAASDDPFDDPEVERLSDEIGTAEQTVESIYERRVGKVVKLASIAAAGMTHQEDGLTVEEERLFERLVDAIEENRERVLTVLDGESPSLDCTPADPTGTEAGTGTDRAVGAGPGDADPGVGPGATEGARAGQPDTVDSPDPTDAPSAPDPGADATGRSDTGPADAAEGRPTPPDRPSAGDADPTPTPAEDAVGRDDGESRSLDIAGAMGSTDDGGDPTGEDAPAPVTGTGSGTETPVEAGTDGPDGPAPVGRREGTDDGEDDPVERTTIRVTADVGDIFGVDGRSYDLSAEDVVTLPTPNAENLVSKEAAERLD